MDFKTKIFHREDDNELIERRVLRLEEKVNKIEERLELEHHSNIKPKQRPWKGIIIKEKLEENNYINTVMLLKSISNHHIY